jgi:hypothetical protein
MPRVWHASWSGTVPRGVFSTELLAAMNTLGPAATYREIDAVVAVGTDLRAGLLQASDLRGRHRGTTGAGLGAGVLGAGPVTSQSARRSPVAVAQRSRPVPQSTESLPVPPSIRSSPP